MDEEIYMRQNPDTGVFEEVCRFTHYNPPKHKGNAVQKSEVPMISSEDSLRSEAKRIEVSTTPFWFAKYVARKYQEQKDVL